MAKLPLINLTDTIELIMREIIRVTPLFNHIDMARTSVCVATNRRGNGGGIYGKLVPLRFQDGSQLIRHRGRIYRMPDIIINGVQQLYIVYFYMPKFFDLGPKEKINVLFHEMYHINPAFNGEIRRMGKTKVAHGGSRARYDSLYHREMNNFFEMIRLTPYINFLSLDSKGFFNNFDSIRGTRMKMPRPMLVGSDNRTTRTFKKGSRLAPVPGRDES